MSVATFAGMARTLHRALDAVEPSRPLPRGAPAASAAVQRVLALHRDAGNAAVAGMLRPPGPAPAVQRVVLHDVDVDRLKFYGEGHSYLPAAPYVSEFEIYKSALDLARINGMDKPYPIRAPRTLDERRRTEPFILVGHGGHGEFLNIPPPDLEGYLLSWGVGPGSVVVFAGCSSSQAAAAIDVVRRITGRLPIVNKELAFTVPASVAPARPAREMLVPDVSTQQAFAQRRGELVAVDRNLLLALGNLLTTNFFAAVDDTTYDLAAECVPVFRKMVGDGKDLKLLPNNKKVNVAALDREWQAIVGRFSGPGKKADADKLLEKLRGALRTLQSKPLSGASAGATLDAIPAELKNAYAAARSVMDAFLERVPTMGGARPTDYRYRAARYLLRTAFSPRSGWSHLPEDVVRLIGRYL